MNQAATPSLTRRTAGAIRPAVAPGSSTTTRVQNDKPATAFDALTELFLGDGCLGPGQNGRSGPDVVARVEPVAVTVPVIEALVLGHLPVLASAWVGQYARHTAQALGCPVALLRVRAGSISVDLVGGPSGKGAWDPEPLETLEGAIRDGLACAERWIVSVEATNEPRIAAMLRPGGIDTVTLLTGTDEAAVVACYRTIKSMLSDPHRDRNGDGESDDTPVRIQLGVMGAPADKAGEAGDRLAHAAEMFLGQRPTVIACVSKIGGAMNRPLYRGSDDRSLEDIVTMIRRVGGTAQAARAVPVKPQEPTPMRAAALPKPAPILSTAPTPAATAGRVGLPIPGPQDTGGAELTPRLTGHIAGLSPIRLSCPYVTRVELAKSPDGRLHLLAQTEEGVGLGGAVAHLAGAAAWAVKHADLLTAACMGLALNAASAPPVLHVFTDRAPDVRSLLDSDVHVHLLTQPKESSGSTWVCVDLN